MTYETNSLSNRMFTLLQEAKDNSGITLERMLEISQTTGGACVRRGWLNWKQASERFVLTPAGSLVLESFGRTYIDRKNHKLPLSKYIQSTYLKKKGLTHDRPQRHRLATARSRRAVAGAA